MKNIDYLNKAFVYIAIFSGYMLCQGCGTLGGFDERTFPTSKKNLEIAIDTLFAKHPEYKIPGNWKQFDDWSSRGFDFLETRIFHLDSSSLPEELYYVSFVGNPPDADPNRAVIAIRAINRGHWPWYKEENFGKAEREIIEKRFDTSIIPKLEEYTHTKADR